MSTKYKKFVCVMCGWEGYSDDLLILPPHYDKEQCPECLQEEGLIRVLVAGGSNESS
ncbi:hypothetical protein [Marinomonas fungiae]|uniref:hypothetical protein n=1 Tax=Marinomonas fungiae TaxID=1137284 RepID=UPI003A93CD69